MFDAPTKWDRVLFAPRFILNLVRHAIRFKHCVKPISIIITGLGLSACTQTEEVQYGDVGFVQGFYGAVSVNEPTAALVGRDILTAGGSAADAAVGVSFALSVTYPSAITLGGGGVCLVHDSRLGLTEVMDFIPPAGPGLQGADRPSAVPTLTRGMAALHARYGQLPWNSLVSPAERMARLGHRISRAFSTEINRIATSLYKEPDTRALFAPEGQLLQEGERLEQPDLAAILGQIRVNGAGAFYTGNMAQRIVEGVQRAGGTLTYEALRDYTPEWRTSLIVPFANSEAHFTPPPAAAGPMLAVMWRLLSTDQRYAELPEGEKAHFLAEVMKRAGADRKTWLTKQFTSSIPVEDLSDPERIAALLTSYSPSKATPGRDINPGQGQLSEVISGTGFVILDRGGQAVACNLSNFNPFGTGRVAEGTGILLAVAPGLPGRNPFSMGPALVIRQNSLNFEFMAASGGGFLGPPGIIKIMADTLLSGKNLDTGIKEPRIYALDAPDIVFVEKGDSDVLAASLKQRGHPVSLDQWAGRVAAIHCPTTLGPRVEKMLCRAVHDPRGSGLSLFSEEGR